MFDVIKSGYSIKLFIFRLQPAARDPRAQRRAPQAAGHQGRPAVHHQQVNQVRIKNKKNTRQGVDRVKPKDWFRYYYYSTVFVYPESWKFDNGASSKIDDVLTEHGGLLHILPQTVHLNFF